MDPVEVQRAPVEVDLDIETDEGDRTYLWGALLTNRGAGTQKYHHFSSFSYLSPSAEVEVAASFARWLVRLATRHPSLLVYHYSDYEVVHLRRLAQRSEHPDLLAACDLVKEHFVDLFQVIRDNFVAVDGLGLKVVASKGAGFSWRDEEPGGLNSQTWFATPSTAPPPRTGRRPANASSNTTRTMSSRPGMSGNGWSSSTPETRQGTAIRGSGVPSQWLQW